MVIKGDNMWKISSRIFISILFLIFLSGCSLYSLSGFGSCNQWIIYSEKDIKINVFKMNVCASKLGYESTFLNRKKLNEIQNIVYSDLNDLIQNKLILNSCKLKKESITFGYGISNDPLEARVVCKNRIVFEQKKGRFFMTSFKF